MNHKGTPKVSNFCQTLSQRNKKLTLKSSNIYDFSFQSLTARPCYLNSSYLYMLSKLQIWSPRICFFLLNHFLSSRRKFSVQPFQTLVPYITWSSRRGTVMEGLCGIFSTELCKRKDKMIKRKPVVNIVENDEGTHEGIKTVDAGNCCEFSGNSDVCICIVTWNMNGQVI